MGRGGLWRGGRAEFAGRVPRGVEPVPWVARKNEAHVRGEPFSIWLPTGLRAPDRDAPVTAVAFSTAERLRGTLRGTSPRWFASTCTFAAFSASRRLHSIGFAFHCIQLLSLAFNWFQL